MKKMKKAKYLNSILSLLVGSKSGADEAEELAPVDSLNEEDFEKAFDDMMNEPVGSESTPMEEEHSSDGDVPDDKEGDGEEEDGDSEPEPTDTEGSEDEEVEHPEDTEKEPEDDSDEKESNGDTEGETEDSTKEKTDNENTGFDFGKMPMDELLPMEINANGMKMKATMNELVAGFQKGMNYTQKMQELSGVKKLVSIATSNDLSEEDLNLLVEAKKGSQEAIAKLMANSNVDALDIDTEEHKDYKPADYSKEEVDIEMDGVRSTINSDAEFKPFVESAIQTMPQDMYDTVSGSAQNLNSLYQDIKSGIYSKVMPEVKKLQNLYGHTEPTMDTYLKVANQIFDDEESSTQAEQQESEEKKEERNLKRKKVAPTSKAPAKKSFISKDVDSLGEDDFDKEFAKITGRSLDDYR